ncbi:MAG TPA: PEP-utilizing enzyme [Conexibacter sp.]
MADADRSEPWVTAVARQHTPLFLSFLVSGQERRRIETETGLPVGFDAIRRDGIALQYARDELTTARAVIGARRHAEGLAFFETYAQRCLASCDRLLAVVEELGAEAGAGDLRRTLEPYFAGAIAHATFLQTLILTQFELEDVLHEVVSSRLGGRPADAAAASAALRLALEPTHEVLNLTELLELGAEVQRSVSDWSSWIDGHPADLIVRIAGGHAAIWDRVLAYERRFAWMGRMYYAGQPVSAGDVVLRLQNILARDCAGQLAAIAVKRDRALAERERAIARLGGDDEARRLADVVSSYMHLRSHRLDVFFIAHERMWQVVDDAAHALELSGHDAAIQLAWRELLDGLDGRDRGDLAALATDRARGFAFRASAGELEWIAPIASAGTAATRTPAAQDGLLEGVTACPGSARGSVRLVRSEEDMLAMRTGEVLVTTMTMPSLMLAVEKAGAIVTDEGGMLCHAALVSREFGIPCVIGTVDATRRLRTGDVVEVDAGRGVVRVVDPCGSGA